MYKGEFGDCLLQHKFLYRGYVLGTWISTQRGRKDSLTVEKVKRLDELGFVWDRHGSLWEKGFKYLTAYKEEFGDCLIKNKSQYGDYNLGSWVSTQRNRKDSLTVEKVNRLDELGFAWDVEEYQWEEGFKHLAAYKGEFGDCLVAAKSQFRNSNLGWWVRNQRKIKSQLTAEQISSLDELGFVWDPRHSQWEKGFKYLVFYNEEFGDCVVKKTAQYRGYSLGTWVSTQRNKKDSLTVEKVNRLDELGFAWDVIEHQWEEGLKYLAAYKKEFGDCLVKKTGKYCGYNLPSWVKNLRSKKDQLTVNKIKRLDELGFVWNPRQSRWEEGFEHLIDYKKEFGNCLVAQKFQYHSYNLGGWVSRQKYSKEKLTLEQVTRLDDLGFVWRVE